MDGQEMDLLMESLVCFKKIKFKCPSMEWICVLNACNTPNLQAIFSHLGKGSWVNLLIVLIITKIYKFQDAINISSATVVCSCEYIYFATWIGCLDLHFYIIRSRLFHYALAFEASDFESNVNINARCGNVYFGCNLSTRHSPKYYNNIWSYR